MINIDYIKASGWEDVKEAALTTIHKNYSGGEITPEWKEKILLSGHSPIRELIIKIKFSDIPRWIADQLVRHNVGVNNYMGTGRSDRIGIPRSEQTMEMLTEFKQTYNGQSFLHMTRTRMCIGSVSKETRELIETLVKKLAEFEPELALFCTPPCIYNGGCKEVFGGCNHLKTFHTSLYGKSYKDEFLNLLDRYKTYRYYMSGE